MELALCLAPGLDVNGVSILYKGAKPSLQVSSVLLLLLLICCCCCCQYAVVVAVNMLLLSLPTCCCCRCQHAVVYNFPFIEELLWCV